MLASPVLRRLLRGAAWIGIVQAVTSAAGFAVALVLAYVLSPAEYGEYNFVMACVGVMSVFGLPGFGPALNLAASAGQELLAPALKLTLMFSLLGSAALLATGLWLPALLPGQAVAFWPFAAAALGFPLLSAGRLYIGVLSGRHDVGTMAAVMCVATTLSSATLAVAAWLGRPTAEMVFASVVVPGAVTFGYCLHLVGRERPSGDVAALRAFALRLSLAQIPAVISTYADRLVVGGRIGFGDLGLYSYAQVVPEQVRGFSKGLSWLIVPEIVQAPERIAHRATFLARLALLTGAAAALVAVYAAVAPWLYAFLFPRFAAAAPYSQLFAVSLLAVPAFFPTSVLQSKASSAGIVLADGANAAVQLALFVLLIPSLGVWGAVVGKVVGRLVAYGVLTAAALRHLDKGGAELHDQRPDLA